MQAAGLKNIIFCELTATVRYVTIKQIPFHILIAFVFTKSSNKTRPKLSDTAANQLAPGARIIEVTLRKASGKPQRMSSTVPVSI